MRNLFIALLCITSFACRKNEDRATAESTVNVYCSVDEVFARTVLEQFEQESGVRLAVTFDTEAGKTTGLVNKIIAESQSGRPRADVFWSGELFNTIRLARMGYLQPYEPATADDIPERYRDKVDVRRFGTGERIAFLPYSEATFQQTQDWIHARGIFPDRPEALDYASSVAA